MFNELIKRASHNGTLTHAAGTSFQCTRPTNAPTPGMQDYEQSLTPSYALQLWSFPRLSAALSKSISTKICVACFIMLLELKILSRIYPIVKSKNNKI